MPRVRLFHWRAEEAKPLLTLLKAAGYSVDYKEPVSSYREVRLCLPDAVVIDLSRLPSHGREVAVFLRGSKATRHIPIVFAGGEPEKSRASAESYPTPSIRRFPACAVRCERPSPGLLKIRCDRSR